MTGETVRTAGAARIAVPVPSNPDLFYNPRSVSDRPPGKPGVSMDRPVRIGAVNYLNTKPLIEGLEELAPEAELILDLPSRLADRLAAGDLDVGLIPIIEYFRH